MRIMLLFRGVFRLGFREKMLHYFSSHGVTTPTRPGPFHYPGFTITLGNITHGRLPWTSYRPDAETPDYSQNSQDKNKPAPGEIRTRNPRKREGASPHLRPRIGDNALWSEK